MSYNYPEIYLLGGGKEVRTPDPLLAKQVLSQLSYTPISSLTAAVITPSLGKIAKMLQIKTTSSCCFYLAIPAELYPRSLKQVRSTPWSSLHR